VEGDGGVEEGKDEEKEGELRVGQGVGEGEEVERRSEDCCGLRKEGGKGRFFQKGVGGEKDQESEHTDYRRRVKWIRITNRKHFSC
jgi:hypothetical protein